MYKCLLTAMACCLCHHVLSQTIKEDSSLKYVRLNEVVISANRFTGSQKHVPQKIDVITPAYISAVNAQNTGDLLTSTGNIFVQKSQQGGSSPVLRGFEASRVLLVVDGVRMNNAIYRAGHLQNVITVDQNMLERAEVMYGPSSTLYGSDALGGVINFRTKRPVLAEAAKRLSTHGGAFTRYSSANNEKTFHANFNLGFKKWAFLTTITYSDFDDMKMGKNYRGKFADFGKRYQYVDQVAGVDSILTNSNPLVQKFSGYRQWDFTEKLLFKPKENITHMLNLQFSNSGNIPRYDRLQDIRDGALRYAEWYYGPQKRTLLAYELNIENLKQFFNQLRANFNFQDIEESRHTREYRRYDRLDSRVEKIKVYGFVIDARKMFGKHDLTLGIDGQLNDLRSKASRRNIITGVKSKLDTRYPDGENNMNNFAAFAQHSVKFWQDKFVVSSGLRLQASNLHSSIIDTSTQLHLPYTDIRQSNIAVTGNLGVVYNSETGSRISSVFSSGFRAPNIDDLSRIFESNTASGQLVVPNPDIKPEYTYNVDVGVSQVFAEKLKVEVTAFYTWFRNAIVLAAFTYNGQDSIVYQGVRSRVIANQNRNRAYLYGFNGSITADITNSFSVSSTINYTYGKYKTDPAALTTVYEKQADKSYAIVSKHVSEKPLDHIPPVFGKTSLLYRRERFNIESFLLYNGSKTLDQYNAEGEDNGQYATPEGSLAWTTYNFRGSFKLNRIITLQGAVENITDRNYRYFASGFSAAGRNFILSLRANF
jgi:hemoglobin/transferrin/lactoferrin receptor protein